MLRYKAQRAQFIFICYCLMYTYCIAARSKLWVCGRLLAGFVASNPAGTWTYVSRGSVVCRQVKVSASGISLVHRSPTECSVSEYDLEDSVMRRPQLLVAVAPIKRKNTL